MSKRTKKVELLEHKKSLEVIHDYSDGCIHVAIEKAWSTSQIFFRFFFRSFFLVNQSTFYNTTSTDILPGYKTDHSVITIQISLHSNNRGRGFWKINTLLLNDIEYVNPRTYKGGGVDATPHKVFLQFFQDDFSLAPAVFISCRHIP